MVRGRKNIQHELAPGGADDKPKPGKKKPAEFAHEFECTLKSVSIAKDKASVGLAIPRSKLGVDEADEIFCGAQLSVQLEADPNASKKEPDGQQKLCESTIDFEGIASCGGFGVKSEVINLSLQFVKSEVDLRQLGRFAALKGTVRCTRTGSCVSSSDEDED